MARRKKYSETASAPRFPVYLNRCEMATVLHALRVLQNGYDDEADACDHFSEYREMLPADIEQLIDREKFYVPEEDPYAD